MPEIDLRFSPNGPLTRSTSDLSHILHVVVLIAAMLHIISYNLIEAVSECQILIRYYKTERNDISVYNTLHDEDKWSNVTIGL
jgi:hypothetical protein